MSVKNLVDNFSTAINFWIICSNEDLNDEILSDVVADKWIEYNSNTKVFYCSSKSRHLSVLKRVAQSANADIIYINGIYSPYFNLIPLLFFRSEVKILSPRGMLHSGAIQQKKFKKRIYLFILKFFLPAKSLIFHATNFLEKSYIEKEFGSGSKIMIAENYPRRIRAIKYKKEPDFLLIASVALISPMKNHLAVLNALLQINFNIEYDIYGPVKDEEYWAKCKMVMKVLPRNIKVSYHGDIKSIEVEKALSDCHIYVQPSVSENFGHSLFEALSAGKPIITSNGTPWNELESYKAGLNVNPECIEELVAAISFFGSMEDGVYQDWSDSAIKYSQMKISLEDINKDYENLFQIS